jgi:hypothetical protein
MLQRTELDGFVGARAINKPKTLTQTLDGTLVAPHFKLLA